MDNIFDKFIVVDEKLYAGIIMNNYKDKTFTDVNQFVTLKLTETYRNESCLKITDIGDYTDSEDDASTEASTDNGDDTGSKASDAPPLAQIIQWKWKQKGEQKIIKTRTVKNGQYLAIHYDEFLDPFVIRILKKKGTTIDSPCPSLSSPDDDLTVQIGREKITVSAHWLMSVSPMIRRMLSVDMQEKKQRLVTLNDLGVEMGQFMEFLEFISPEVSPTTLHPNPKNVLMLLKLADYFQVDWLKKRCDLHLINCVEIPLIDRFLLIEKYGLENLKHYFLRLNVDKLRAFFGANREQIVATTSKELLCRLIGRTCNSIKEEKGSTSNIENPYGILTILD